MMSAKNPAGRHALTTRRIRLGIVDESNTGTMNAIAVQARRSVRRVDARELDWYPAAGTPELHVGSQRIMFGCSFAILCAEFGRVSAPALGIRRHGGAERLMPKRFHTAGCLAFEVHIVVTESATE